MDKTKVSILVPAYNDYIEECLRSLISQTLREIEVVVVDDGSTDQTAVIAERYAITDSRIRVIRLPEHQGVSQARNVCLAEAQGEYLAFVDSDDYISADAIEGLLEKAIKCQADIVLGSILYCYPDGRQVRVGDKSTIFHTDDMIMSGQECFIRMQQKGCYSPIICGNLYRTTFVKEHPQLHFEGEFHEDDYFTPYALYFAKRITCLKENIYFYRKRQNSTMNSCKNVKQRALSLFLVGIYLERFVNQLEKYNPNIITAYNLHSNILRQRAQNLYEKELLTSSRKGILVLIDNRIHKRDFYQFLLSLNPKKWNISILNIQTTDNWEVMFHIKDGMAWYNYSMPQRIRSTNYKEKYLKSIFYYCTSHIINENNNLYCFYSASQFELAMMLKKQLHFITFQQYDDYRKIPDL